MKGGCFDKYCMGASESILIQECIPVGCVPAARRPYAGVCFRGGVLSPRRGVLSLGGVSRGVSDPGVSDRGVYDPGEGVSDLGGDV